MSFNAAIHSFRVVHKKMDSNHYFASKENRKELVAEIKKAVKWETGKDYICDEDSKKCAAFLSIERNNFLSDIQEYAAGQENRNLEAVYMGKQQSCYSHLIEIQNSIGIFLPIFFFFPLHISTKSHALPIFIGSSIKLHSELRHLNKSLKAKENTALEEEITPFLEATEEDVEDYEFQHDGVDTFWPCFNYLVLSMLAKRSVATKSPIFIF